MSVCEFAKASALVCGMSGGGGHKVKGLGASPTQSARGRAHSKTLRAVRAPS